MMLSAVTLAILAASCASAKVVDVQGISSVTSLKDADLFAVGAGAFEASSITRRQSEFPSFDSGDSDGEVDGGAVMAEGETSFMGPDGNEFGTGWAAASGDEFTVGDGIEKADSASAPSCLVYINKFRKSLGVPALKYVASRSTCVANQVCRHGTVSSMGRLARVKSRFAGKRTPRDIFAQPCSPRSSFVNRLKRIPMPDGTCRLASAANGARPNARAQPRTSPAVCRHVCLSSFFFFFLLPRFKSVSYLPMPPEQRKELP